MKSMLTAALTGKAPEKPIDSVEQSADIFSFPCLDEAKDQIAGAAEGFENIDLSKSTPIAGSAPTVDRSLGTYIVS